MGAQPPCSERSERERWATSGAESPVVSLGGRGGEPTVARCQTAGRRMLGGLAVARPREVAGLTAQAVARGALRPSSSPSVLRSSSISGQWMP